MAASEVAKGDVGCSEALVMAVDGAFAPDGVLAVVDFGFDADVGRAAEFGGGVEVLATFGSDSVVLAGAGVVRGVATVLSAALVVAGVVVCNADGAAVDDAVVGGDVAGGDVTGGAVVAAIVVGVGAPMLTDRAAVS